LSFKIILIQKFQIYIFRKGLKLYEFENAFDLNLNLDFKFKSAKKIQSNFYFLWPAQIALRPQFSSSPANLLIFFLFLSRTSLRGFSAHAAHKGPAPLVPFLHKMILALPPPASLRSLLTLTLSHPVPSPPVAKWNGATTLSPPLPTVSPSPSRLHSRTPLRGVG
jgi:hypothetical protein